MSSLSYDSQLVYCPASHYDLSKLMSYVQIPGSIAFVFAHAEYYW